MSPDRPKLRFRRRNYLINPRFQLRLLAAIWLIVGAAMAIAALATAFYFLFVRQPAGAAVVEGWSGTFGQGALAMLVLLVLLVWASVLVTHRIAGPIYRLLRALEAVEQGELQGPVRLRRGDAFQEVAKQLNTTVEALRAERERLEARTKSLHKHAHDKAESLRKELARLSSARKNGQLRLGLSASREEGFIERAEKICSELTELFP